MPHSHFLSVWSRAWRKEVSVQVRWGFPEVLEQPCVPAAVVKLCCFFKGPFLLLGMKDTSLELYQTASAEPWKFKTGSISLTGKGFTKWNLWLLCGRCLLKTNPTPAGYSEVVQSLKFNLLWNISSLCAWVRSCDLTQIWLSLIWFGVQRLWRAKPLHSAEQQLQDHTKYSHSCREFGIFFNF